jgi:hypothetical protein
MANDDAAAPSFFPLAGRQMGRPACALSLRRLLLLSAGHQRAARTQHTRAWVCVPT